MNLTQVAETINQATDNVYSLPYTLQAEVLWKLTKYFDAHKHQETSQEEWNLIEKAICKMLENSKGDLELIRQIGNIEMVAEKKFLGLEDKSYLPVVIQGPEGQYIQPLQEIIKMSPILENKFTMPTKSERFLDISNFSPTNFKFLMSFICDEYYAGSSKYIDKYRIKNESKKIEDSISVIEELHKFSEEYKIIKLLQICSYKLFDLQFNKNTISSEYKYPIIYIEDIEARFHTTYAILTELSEGYSVFSDNETKLRICMSLHESYLEKIKVAFNELKKYKNIIDCNFFKFSIDAYSLERLVNTPKLWDFLSESFAAGTLSHFNIELKMHNNLDNILEITNQFRQKITDVFGENYSLTEISE